MHKIRISFAVSTLFIFMSACQPTPISQAPQSDNITDIHVNTSAPTEAHVSTEKFTLPNCGGTGEIHQTLGTTASITKSVTVSGKATVRGGGEASIPEVAKLKLEIEIEAAYQKTYETANSRLDTINMPAAAGTHVVYEIGWYEQLFSSIVEYSSNGQVYEAPYTYSLRIPKIDNSYQVACEPNATTSVNPSNTQPSSETTETANWAIIFEYRFPSSFWSVGTHEYTLDSECPKLEGLNGSWTNTFNVSENVTLLSGDVYLRLVGLREDQLPSTPIESINPLQTTTAAFTIIDATQSEAELAFTDCKVSISWDGGTPKELTPGLPFER